MQYWCLNDYLHSGVVQYLSLHQTYKCSQTQTMLLKRTTYTMPLVDNLYVLKN